MRKLVAAIACAGVVMAGLPVAVRAQESAALEQQKAAAATELASLNQKVTDREKAINEQPAIVEAKKGADTAEAAFRDFEANNAGYSAAVKARAATSTASAKALEAAKTNDAVYVSLRKQGDEVTAKRREIEPKLRDAAPDAQTSLKEELASLDKQARDINQKKEERRKGFAEKPELAEANKAAQAAEKALQDIVKDDADYNRLAKARNESATLYRATLDKARTSDAEYGALKAQQAAANAKVNELNRKIAEAAKAP